MDIPTGIWADSRIHKDRSAIGNVLVGTIEKREVVPNVPRADLTDSSLSNPD